MNVNHSQNIYTTCKNVRHTQTWYKVTYTFGKPAKRVQEPLSIRNPLQWCQINPNLSTTARTHKKNQVIFRVTTPWAWHRIFNVSKNILCPSSGWVTRSLFNDHDRNGGSTATNKPQEYKTKKTPSIRQVARTSSEPGTFRFQKRYHLYLVFGFGVRVWYSTVTSVFIKRAAAFQHTAEDVST